MRVMAAIRQSSAMNDRSCRCPGGNLMPMGGRSRNGARGSQLTAGRGVSGGWGFDRYAHVGAGPPVSLIRVEPSAQDVVAPTTMEHVGAGAADEDVVAVSAEQHVLAGAAMQGNRVLGSPRVKK